MSSRHVLIVDDDPDVRHGVGFMLGLAGYTAHPARSRAEALDCLKSEILHAAILDIRLEGGDATDDSGLRLAAELPATLPRIIYTGYADPAYLRRALEERGGIRAAHKFVEKGASDAPEQLLSGLADLFTAHVTVNFDLVIEEAALLREFGGRLALPDPHGPDAEIARDIEEILRRLFYTRADSAEPAVHSVALTPLLPYHLPSATSRSSAIVLRVQPRFKDGDLGRMQVVKLGDIPETQAEADHHRAFVERLATNHYAQLEDKACARWVGGLRYSFIGANDLEQVMLFSAYYAAHSAADASDCLARFFQTTYRHILHNKERVTDRDLRRDYVEALHLTPEKVRRALLDYLPEAALAETHLTLPELENQTLLNPYAWAVGEEGAFRPCVQAATYVAWGHGDFHSHNLLVDGSEHGWLIDCARAGRGHVLRDFVELETDIKFSLLPVTDLSRLWLFESALLTPAHLGQPAPALHADDAELHKAYTVICDLRAAARDLIDIDLDMREYYTALFYQTLNVVRLKPDARWGAALPGKANDRRHALFAAALLAERLNNWPKWPPPRFGPPPSPVNRFIKRVTGALKRR